MRVGEKLGNGGGEQVSGRVAIDFQPFGRRRRDELDRPARFDGGLHVDQARIDPRHKRIGREPRPMDFATSSGVTP